MPNGVALISPSTYREKEGTQTALKISQRKGKNEGRGRQVRKGKEGSKGKEKEGKREETEGKGEGKEKTEDRKRADKEGKSINAKDGKCPEKGMKRKEIVGKRWKDQEQCGNGKGRKRREKEERARRKRTLKQRGGRQLEFQNANNAAQTS